MTKAETVLYSVDGSVASLRLNRPEKKNALNDEMIAELKSGLREANANEIVRAILISGAGSDFCSGADLSSLKTIAQASVSENLADARSLMELFNLFREVQVPVIAAVRGRALAGGCGLASACDLVLASSSARFGYPEVKIGFVPAMVMAILRRNISEKRAFELLTRGAEIGAEQAKEIGLVNQVFSDDQFEEAVVTYAQLFERLSRSAVTLTKTLLYQTDGMAFREALAAGVDVNVIARMSEDCRDGISRFLAKE
ncbi:MAG TPA: enoyl-CoA hydratase-related protein [Pyrinomonadaceae bacterium]